MLHSSFAVICNLICVTRRDEHVQETKSPVRFGPLLGFAHTLFGDVDQVIRTYCLIVTEVLRTPRGEPNSTRNFKLLQCCECEVIFRVPL